MTTNETPLPDLLRDLAERRVPCPSEHPPMLRWHQPCEHCGEPIDQPPGTVPDPRFAALIDLAVQHPDDIAANRHINTDLGAIVEAIAACGLTVSGLGYRTTALGAKGWICDLRLSDTPSAYWWEGVSPDGTPAEAAGRALAAWVAVQP